MKILILGANGMIGHQMWRKLDQAFPGQVWGSVRNEATFYKKFGIFKSERLIPHLDVTDFVKTQRVLDEHKPDVILNCIGITLRKPEIKNSELCLEVNSMFPHRLSFWVKKNKTRLIHFSTDCVFDGSDGLYDEDSDPTAKDVYGKTKFLGEVSGQGCLTLRTPILGREIEGKTELVEWFLAQKNKKIKGFANAIYSGITSPEIAKQVIQIIKNYPNLEGLYQISSQPISKYDLLVMLNEIAAVDATIERDETYATNKSLDSKKYRQLTGYQPPSWHYMLTEMMGEKYDSN